MSSNTLIFGSRVTIATGPFPIKWLKSVPFLTKWSKHNNLKKPQIYFLDNFLYDEFCNEPLVIKKSYLLAHEFFV